MPSASASEFIDSAVPITLQWPTLGADAHVGARDTREDDRRATIARLVTEACSRHARG
jgi:hypothetical protein